MPKCCVNECKSGYHSHPSPIPVKWFYFPSDPDTRKKWILQLNREDFIVSKSTQICSKHFRDPEDYIHVEINIDIKGRPRKHRRLKPTSIPSISMGSQFQEKGNTGTTFLSVFHLWGHSQTMFTAMGGGGVHEMSTLLNKFAKVY